MLSLNFKDSDLKWPLSKTAFQYIGFKNRLKLFAYRPIPHRLAEVYIDKNQIELVKLVPNE